MESRNVSTMALSCLTIFMVLIGLASSDLAKDRAECTDQLISLSTCLPYVSGDSKAPTLDCCSGSKQVLAKYGIKCLCVLVKDRDEPDLGFKINGTLALGLPDLCHLPTNISSCPDLLHLAPHSPEAKIFEEYANSTKSSGSPPVTSDKGSSGGNGTSSASVKNHGGLQTGNIRWLKVEMICGVLLWCFTSHLIYNA